MNYQFEKYYFDVLDDHRNLVPFPEVIDILNKFIDLGYALVLMTNSSWGVVSKNVEALKVPFDIGTAEDIHAYKLD
ncbi:HAD family hydrolase [Companilactobacillus keshanensis]|uniref:HAD family hydrolase n=1 Tax=Companilactobacillus keshanensis TaxID=2486003 RepID=A0ABW4BTZ9_9LACO|nr:hypothetical protein [Companilactobacillus keshanensis]